MIPLYRGLTRSYHANVESIKRDIQALGTAGQEAILKYLEEVVVLGSFATEVTIY